MSVLIKGMAMPKGCLSCPLASGYYIEDTKKDKWASVRCRVLNKKMQVQGVPNDCPLIELPDHEDLTDRDELLLYFSCKDRNPTLRRGKERR